MDDLRLRFIPAPPKNKRHERIENGFLPLIAAEGIVATWFVVAAVVLVVLLK